MYKTGFYDGASDRIIEMHLFKDISAEEESQMVTRNSSLLVD